MNHASTTTLSTPNTVQPLHRSALRLRYRPQRSALPRWILAAAFVHGVSLLLCWI